MKHLLSLGLLIATVGASSAAPTLSIHPNQVEIRGSRSQQQLLVTLRDGSAERDATRLVRWTIESAQLVSISPDGVLTPKADGQTTVTAELNGIRVSTQVQIRGMAEPMPVSFRDEIIPVLNRAGCNQGACHGTPNGKGGFRLSLRGFDVPFDYRALTREGNGRRTLTHAPDESLLILKGLARIPHQGGQKMLPGSQEHRLLAQWMREGLRDDPKNLPELDRLEITPSRRMIQLTDNREANTQQVQVTAYFRDGTQRDVTHLCAFSTSNEELADVSPFGLVRPRGRGEIAVLARYLHVIVSARLTFLADRPGFSWPKEPEVNLVDRHVNDKLRLLQITPSPLVGDETFLRRVYLDTLGILPTPEEVRKFLADRDPQKRDKLVDTLLARSEFADFWTLKWSDVLRLNESFMQAPGVKKFHSWIHEWVTADKPLDEFVRQILTATGEVSDAVPGNFFRTSPGPEETAETVAQLFLGVRMSCARCHNHPFEKWTQEDYFGLAAFFAPVEVQVKGNKKAPQTVTIRLNNQAHIKHPRTGQDMSPRLPGGEALDLSNAVDPRKPLADWLVSSQNPFFAKTLANRVWFHLMGRGIVEPVDDFRDSNPAVNDALLEYLANVLVRNNFRLKPLIREILTSRAYQRSATPNTMNKDDALYFSRTTVRLLTAEQLLDAVSQATGVAEKFKDLPPATRAVQIPGSKVDNDFLRAFNRPARNLACECERERDANLSQALQLISSKPVQEKIGHEKGRVAELIKSGKNDTEILEELYLAALTRFPREKERIAVIELLKASNNRREVFEDVLWTLMNSKEFQFRH